MARRINSQSNPIAKSTCGSAAAPLLNVTVPVLNEAECIIPNVRRLAAFLDRLSDVTYEIVIADNGSTDGTLGLAADLAKELGRIRVLHLNERGRGRALKLAWRESQAAILSYTDVDLSTDLLVLPEMLNRLLAKESDLAVASRLLKPDSTRRGIKRELISRTYAGLVKQLFRTTFSDPQCGFKMIRREAAENLLPLTRDNGWFFDTELLVLAEHGGWRIFDIPAPWIERKDTRVQLLPTIAADVRGLFSLRWRLNFEGPLRRLEGAGMP